VSKLDTQWALAEIDALLHVTAQVNPNQAGSGTYYFGTVIRAENRGQRAGVRR